MQNKKVKNIFSFVFIISFISFILMINVFENSEKYVKTNNYHYEEFSKENKYGLFLSSLHADISGDFLKLSNIYPEAILLNNGDFLGKEIILKSLSGNKSDALKFAETEYKKNKSNAIVAIYLSNDAFLKGNYKKAYSYYNDIPHLIHLKEEKKIYC